MTIVITCFRDAIHVDKFGNRYRAKTTCIIKQTPFAERYYLTNGMQVSEHLSRENQVEVIVKLP